MEEERREGRKPRARVFPSADRVSSPFAPSTRGWRGAGAAGKTQRGRACVTTWGARVFSPSAPQPRGGEGAGEAGKTQRGRGCARTWGARVFSPSAPQPRGGGGWRGWENPEGTRGSHMGQLPLPFSKTQHSRERKSPGEGMFELTCTAICPATSWVPALTEPPCCKDFVTCCKNVTRNVQASMGGVLWVRER